MNSIKKLLISLAFVLIILSACSEKKKEVTKLENIDFSELLIIQKVEDNKSTEDNIIVKDKKKIEQILEMVNGIKVEETTSKYMMDEMKSHTSYMFNFEEDKNIQSGEKVAYSFDILDDGTIFFTHKDVHTLQKPRISIKKHKDLLKKIQQLTEKEPKQK